jgi:hypothetical protein
VLTSLLFLGLCAILARHGKPLPADSSEFVLISEFSSSNLNNTSAMATAAPLAAAPQKEVDLGSIQDPVEPATIILVAGHEPARQPCYLFRNPHPGETPMTRIWKLIGLNTLAAALLTAGPSLADTDGQPSTAKGLDTKVLEEIQKQLVELRKDSNTSGTALKGIELELRNLRAESVIRDQERQTQITDLKNDVARLQIELNILRDGSKTETRQPLYPAPQPEPAMGRVEMVNTYSTEVGIRVNRRTYRLAPNETRLSEPIPAGQFSFEVFNVAPEKTRQVAANKVYTIWVHPQ